MQQHESPRELLAEIETIAPILVEQALESEKLGRLDDATWDALRKTRLLRFLCPRELGGDEAWSRLRSRRRGGGALFDTNPLQRCCRDVFAAGQHFLVSQSSYRALGQFKLGQPDVNPML
jgi:Acyl-CoA dehydrogenase, C-terminal domain